MTPDEAVLVSLPYGLCIVDGEGKIVDLNPALEQLLGWRLADLRGQSLFCCLEHDIVDPARALGWTLALSQALDQGRITHLGLPTDFRAGSDDEHPVSVVGVVAPLQGDSAQHSKALVLFHDSTSQKNMEETQTRFLAVLAHELGTPVSNLTAAADLLAKHAQLSDPESWRLLEVIRSEAKHLQRLLTHLPTTSPVWPQPSPVRRRLVTLPPLLRQVAQGFEVRGLNCQITVQAPRGLPFVQSDEEGIKEVLYKLLENAIRYAPPGSQVVLSAAERGDEVVVSVRDQGPGVPEEDRGVIFEPWVRGSQEEPRAEHHGLGLPMARTLVRVLGGRLWYEECLEGGACFSFGLPTAKDLPDDQ